jgi:RNA polymerase sigma-70 factor, ECF subfamily
MFVMGLPTISLPIDSDTALIHDCQAGNVEAYAELVARYRDGIYSFVRHTVGHDADAQDLAQEAFVRAYAALGRFRRGAPFEPWIYRIAANLCRSHLRKARRRPVSLDVGEAETLAAPAADPAVILIGQDERQRLLAAIYDLPVEQRMVVVLRHLRGHSYGQIASILALPVSTVEHRLRAARKVLRERLRDQASDTPGAFQ